MKPTIIQNAPPNTVGANVTVLLPEDWVKELNTVANLRMCSRMSIMRSISVRGWMPTWLRWLRRSSSESVSTTLSMPWIWRKSPKQEQSWLEGDHR